MKKCGEPRQWKVRRIEKKRNTNRSQITIYKIRKATNFDLVLLSMYTD